MVRGWCAESSYSRPGQAPAGKVLKEQGSPALLTKLLEMQGEVVMQELLYFYLQQESSFIKVNIFVSTLLLSKGGRFIG